jgi:hypothetical protein
MGKHHQNSILEDVKKMGIWFGFTKVVSSVWLTKLGSMVIITVAVMG